MSGSETVRTFVALLPSPEQRAWLADAVRHARAEHPESARRFRWTDPATYHLTLAFLGDRSASEVETLIRTVRQVAGRHEPFRWSLGAAGAFPEGRPARVIWVGLERGAAEATALADDLADTLRSAGWELESRRFHPHLTVARARRRPAPPPPIETPGAPASSVTEIVVMRSHLAADGARHTPLAKLPLGEARART